MPRRRVLDRYEVGAATFPVRNHPVALAMPKSILAVDQAIWWDLAVMVRRSGISMRRHSVSGRSS
jgi:hypothetical protein